MMNSLLAKILLVVVCSCYFFPFELNALPGLNSKMATAAVGLVLFCWEHFRHRIYTLRADLIPVLVLGLVFSLSSLMSVAFNGTNDMVFVTYFVSMAVWLGGAYCVIWLMRQIYGKASLQHVFLYLGIMCAGHCILALMIDNSAFLKNFVETVFVTATEYFEHNVRLYSIGVGFDTAGIRFATVLLGLGYLERNTGATARQKIFYVTLFLIIGVIGNMISRSTVIGLAFGLVYMLFPSLEWLRSKITGRNITIFSAVCCCLVLAAIGGVRLYESSPGVRELMDYGFEGFINFFETGTFSTHSSDLILDNIFLILPDNPKTWIIGDGYFADPFDPSKFYMGTDVGFTRLVFYGGLIGLGCFTLYFAYCTYALSMRTRYLTMFFIMMFLIQMVVWIKIPTDIFCTYALMLLCDGHDWHAATGTAETTDMIETTGTTDIKETTDRTVI